ncbi:hypothetical protein F4560_006426 [Saccharothrix ecbatanensis]|uniref:Hydrophobic W protein n=1 Tax=Saccharothrix ecbatanensis TaxID=1105145 RepID=A0A7W9HQN3_9PSEU|nr:hypothetical protein [Saccharothrix ecbatanensis]MBB5806658.1 hypothetical protein [Saccharothrix ecbatanensis]
MLNNFRTAIGVAAVLLGLLAPGTTANADVSQAQAPTGVRSVTTSAELPAGAPPLPVLANAAAPALCMVGHVQDRDWGQWQCQAPGQSAFAGSVGLGKNLEALVVYVSAPDAGSQLCGAAHVRNRGWVQEGCRGAGSAVQYGYTGLNLPLEAFKLKSSTRKVCLEAHVRNQGWVGNGCVNPGEWREVGTTGLALPLEAVRGIVL